MKKTIRTKTMAREKGKTTDGSGSSLYQEAIPKKE